MTGGSVFVWRLANKMLQLTAVYLERVNQEGLRGVIVCCGGKQWRIELVAGVPLCLQCAKAVSQFSKRFQRCRVFILWLMRGRLDRHLLSRHVTGQLLTVVD